MKTCTSAVHLRAFFPVLFLLIAPLCTKRCFSQASVPEYRGVSGAELQDASGHPKNGTDARIVEMGDRVIVKINNLDGWLYDLVRGGNCPKQEWFDPEVLKQIADVDLGTLYQRSSRRDDPQYKQIQNARESIEKMLSDVKQRLYLQLGPARLYHLRPEDPLIRQNQAGIFPFVFSIRDTPEDRSEWNKLRNIHGELRPISISAAFDLEGISHTLPTKLGSSLDSVSPGSPDQQFKFRIYSHWCALTFGVVYLLAIILFCWFAGVPNLLRDPDGPMRDGRHVFSLSRCQLAWWFFVILAAWIFLWVVTSSRDTLNQTALIVTGIGSATALSGAVAGKVRDSLTDAQKSLADVQVDVDKRPKVCRTWFGAFLYDLLSDRDTVGFHRFQLLVWNIILGFVFLWETWSDFTMPEFNSTLLALLGLSAATFVGMKMTPEKT
jgi:hypothetical protein